MSDLRYDPIFDHWVAIAENRRDRPLEFLPLEQMRKPLICPFCGGNEDETPVAILMLDDCGERLPDRQDVDWLARVIPNKFPTFELAAGAVRNDVAPYRHQSGVGLQELIIPTPRHVASVGELLDIEIFVGLKAAQIRLSELCDNPVVKHVTLFMNCRYEAGASLEHIHLQMIGSPIVSPFLQHRADRFRSFQHPGQTLVQSTFTMELESGHRVLSESTNWLAFCPFASRQAFQIRIAPLQSGTPFWSLGDEAIRELGELLQVFVNRYENLFGHPSYNIVLHQLPFAETANDHWFIELFPRLSKAAGYEYATDIWINPISPEVAARRLR